MGIIARADAEASDPKHGGAGYTLQVVFAGNKSMEIMTHADGSTTLFDPRDPDHGNFVVINEDRVLFVIVKW